MSSYEDDVEPLPETSATANTNRTSTAATATSTLGKRSRDDSQPNKQNKASKSTLQSKDNDKGKSKQKETDYRLRELSPEPNENFDLSSGANTQMWLVKIPNFLLDSWKKIDKDDVLLGTVRVYTDEKGETSGMELRLPEAPAPAIPDSNQTKADSKASSSIPRVYDMRSTDTAATRARNMFAFKETFVPEDDEEEEEQDGDRKDNGKGKGKERNIDGSMLRRKGKRYTEFSGRISNEAALKPQMTLIGSTSTSNPLSSSKPSSLLSAEYRQLMRQRKEEASKPKRSVILFNDQTEGEGNRIASGISGAKKKAWSFAPTAKTASSAKEKMVRLPLNELNDALFRAFEQYPYWTSKALRERTKQPESYLKEALSEIADLQKRGPYANNWSLKEGFKSKSGDGDAGEASGSGQTSVGNANGNGNGNGDGEANGNKEDESSDDESEDFENYEIN